MKRRRAQRTSLPFVLIATQASLLMFAAESAAQTIANGKFNVQIGANGEIASLHLAADTFPTDYVMNATNAPGQNTADHAWVGELMFTYRLGSGSWTTALTSQSADARKTTNDATSVTVTYQNSTNAKGVQNFKVVETYALVDDYLAWRIAVTNTATESLEIGDFGLPLPFNEHWFGGDVVYETRTVYHSFTGQNSSFITASRPSGVGPFLLLVPDATTGAGFEYMDNWRTEEHAGSAWAAGGGKPAWSSGLDVFYLHSNVIKSTHRGYLPNTSLVVAPGETRTYAFKFFGVMNSSDVEDRLYREGLIDVSVVPGMMFATDMTAKFDLHTTKAVNSITPQYPAETTVTALGTTGTDHHLYSLVLRHLGPNDVKIDYGNGEKTTLQFYALEPVDAALQRHATFMAKTQRSDANATMYKVFDDWMMDTQSTRGATGGWGWGDDWGWTKGQFLAEKNAQTPVASEVTALEEYLAAIWGTEIDPQTFTVNDWWCPSITTPNCGYDRPYAYAHAFNTFYSMYKVRRLYPALIAYRETADTYLMRAYGILHRLYTGGKGDPATGYMGEQTLPDIQRALTDEGHATEAQFVSGIVSQLYAAFKSSAYPYGSEYSYDNTGEEAVYMAANANGDTAVLGKVNTKTRACRGHQPVWYYYADPVTLNGENWWQFQYTASLAGQGMDDWVRNHSATPEEDERLSYAAKLLNISAINSGQIDTAAANLGAVSWTYQAMKGDVYIGVPDTGKLHSGWRQMSGEADLGLFGALRILSSDVAIDPIFGLYGYGCDVALSGGCYAITPRDGVFKRLNLITEKLHIELDRDRYSGATVSAAKDFLGLTLQNQTGDAHTTKLTIAGFALGTYGVAVDAVSAGTVTVTGGQTIVVPLAIGANATYAVRIGTGCGGSIGGNDAGRDAPGGAGGSAGSGGGGSGGAGPGGTAGNGAGGNAGRNDAGTRDASAGAAGASGSGGAAGAGAGGNAGSNGRGGATGGRAGSGDATGDGGTSSEPASQGDCDCAMGNQRANAGTIGSLLLGSAAMLGARRRRRAPKPMARKLRR